MNSASISEIKKELQRLDADALHAICLRLAKYKKENKELLSYLLSDAHDEAGYIRSVKEEMDVMFLDLDGRNLYIVKKMLRKILRMANRQIKYSGIPQTELELRIYFCEKVKEADIPLTQAPCYTIFISNNSKKSRAYSLNCLKIIKSIMLMPLKHFNKFL
ncbi:MAG: hypothetical protein RI909_452 [Bacteroidota bacterium]